VWPVVTMIDQLIKKGCHWCSAPQVWRFDLILVWLTYIYVALGLMNWIRWPIWCMYICLIVDPCWLCANKISTIVPLTNNLTILYLSIKSQNFSLPNIFFPWSIPCSDRLLRPTFLEGQKQNKKHSRVSNEKSHITHALASLGPISPESLWWKREKNKKFSRVSNVKSPIYFS